MDEGGSLKRELRRTARLLVEIVEKQGIYFAIALLLDSSYDADRIRALLPILHDTAGAVKINRKSVNPY